MTLSNDKLRWSGSRPQTWWNESMLWRSRGGDTLVATGLSGTASSVSSSYCWERLSQWLVWFTGDTPLLLGISAPTSVAAEAEVYQLVGERRLGEAPLDHQADRDGRTPWRCLLLFAHLSWEGDARQTATTICIPRAQQMYFLRDGHGVFSALPFIHCLLNNFYLILYLEYFLSFKLLNLLFF